MQNWCHTKRGVTFFVLDFQFEYKRKCTKKLDRYDMKSKLGAALTLAVKIVKFHGLINDLMLNNFVIPISQIGLNPI